MGMNRTRLTSALIEIILAITLLSAFATYKLINKVDSLTVHVAQLSSHAAQAQVVNVSIDDDRFDGDSNAPVTIIEFSDYECPFCARHYRETYPRIYEKYIWAGEVRYAVMNFPADYHQFAQMASEAALCAQEQGEFWSMHDALFENWDNLSLESFKKLAREIGLDGTIFDDCLDSGTMALQVEKDLADGISYGVNGTPVFFINGKILSGARSFEEFDSAIQKALEEQGPSGESDSSLCGH
jgi:protein-disulfide isomerase